MSSHFPNRLLVKHNCEIEQLLEDHAPNVFGWYEVKNCWVSGVRFEWQFNAVAVCAISDNEETKSEFYPFLYASTTLVALGLLYEVPR
jgi:hypothetical protein